MTRTTLILFVISFCTVNLAAVAYAAWRSASGGRVASPSSARAPAPSARSIAALLVLVLAFGVGIARSASVTAAAAQLDMQVRAEEDRVAEVIRARETQPASDVTVVQTKPPAKGAFVYLGQCGPNGWVHPLFDGLPTCARGNVSEVSSATIVAKDWVAMHTSPPELVIDPEMPPTVGQVAPKQNVTLVDLQPMAKRFQRHYWGHVVAAE